jgi:hypothetical protein
MVTIGLIPCARPRKWRRSLPVTGGFEGVGTGFIARQCVTPAGSRPINRRAVE